MRILMPHCRTNMHKYIPMNLLNQCKYQLFRVCLNTLVYLICLFCDYVGTNPIYRRYMEISFNYLVYFGGHF